ncbi:unannotated protein [freshwater metagenome]|uniref:Unannotated protein n=1 Tax=freshwater metagenome TaxID=449393 RepID=A0A6J6JNK7_9ZZZZ
MNYRSARRPKCRRRTSTQFPLKSSRGFPATRKSKNEFANTCDGTQLWRLSMPTRMPMALAGTFPRTRHQRCCLKLVSIISSAGEKERWLAITCTCRVMRRQAFMRAHTSKADSAKKKWRSSAAKSVAEDSRVTRTHGSCPSFGSSQRFRWDSVRSIQFTKRDSASTSTTDRSTTRAQRRCGVSSAMAKPMSPKPLARSHLPPANNSTISFGS